MEKRIDVEKAKQLLELINSSKSIVITTHVRPDGDAIGSSLALYNYLSDGGHKVNVLTPDAFPSFFNWMKGSDSIIKVDTETAKAMQLLENADLIFCLDFNDPSRFGSLGNKIPSVKAKKVMIDHHLNPSDFCDLTFSYPNYSATAEILFDILTAFDAKINKPIAEALYTGIMTDTGSFRFPSTSAHTHNIVSSLIETGVEHNTIYDNVYDNYSLDRMRFVGHCLLKKLKVFPEYHTALIDVSKEELTQFNHQPGDTEGIVNEALAIKGVNMAALFTERDTTIRISFRSKGDFSVKEIAEQHFNGGGHQNAAGGRSTDTLENTVKKFVDLLPNLINSIA